MSDIPVPPDQSSSPNTSRRPSVDLDVFPDKPIRRPLQTKFEKPGHSPTGTQSTPTSRRPSLTGFRRPSASSSRRPSVVSSGDSSRRSSVVAYDPESDQPPTPPPPKPSPPPVPPCPDLFKPPYAKPLGSVFQGEDWDPLINILDERIIKVIGVCQSVAINLNMDVDDISWTGLHYNIWALDDITIADITRDCWMIMYEIIGRGYEWAGLLEESNLLARVKRNLRQSQPRLRWDVACDTMLSLGFTDTWLYE